MSYETLSRQEKHEKLLEILHKYDFHITYWEGDINSDDERDALPEMFKEIEEIIQTYES